MTTPSAFQGTGLSISVFAPVLWGGTFFVSLTEEVGNYQHSTVADGGYLSAAFSLGGRREDIDDWLEYGLGRDIKTMGPAGDVVWEGFVNQVSVTIGGITTTRGPLTNLANRVSVVYTPIIDETVDPPVTGATTETTIAEDTVSQAKYGIWEKVISSGNLLPADAAYIRDLYLAENAYPETDITISLGGGGGEMSVSVQCRGYQDWMGYIYNNTTSPTSTTASVKVAAVRAADPNAIFSTSTAQIHSNAVLVPSFEDENRTARGVVDEITSMGGGSDDRWLFGVYNGRVWHFKAASTTIDYYYYVADGLERVETSNGASLAPWEVMPGKWAALPDYLVGGRVRSTDLRFDPRTFFVEQVDFTAPMQITLSGKKVRTLPQLLAKLGVGGVG